jgi:hypothetical protein
MQLAPGKSGELVSAVLYSTSVTSQRKDGCSWLTVELEPPVATSQKSGGRRKAHTSQNRQLTGRAVTGRDQVTD